MKKEILEAISDWVLDMLVYDRRNDEELPEEKVHQIINNGEITLEELTIAFRTAVKEHFPNIKEN